MSKQDGSKERKHDGSDGAEAKGEKKEKKKKKKDKEKGEAAQADRYSKSGRIKRDFFEAEIDRLGTELVIFQHWVKVKGLKIVVIFEGRDAAGKGGVIKTIADSMNPRSCRVVALGTPTEREKTQWYFQRYVAHLPAAGEIALFDRSWYNRAGVEKVMGFCTMHEYRNFLVACPMFERMLVSAGIMVVKYWFSVSDDEQERRFRDRAETPAKRWKLSPMDIESRGRWIEYSKAKDAMFEHTDTSEAPWWVVDADDKRRARLNCIKHLLSQVPYEDLLPKDRIDIPPRKDQHEYVRPPLDTYKHIPKEY